MKSAEGKNPKDEHITNKDDSVTNRDGNTMLEKGTAKKTEDKAATIILSNDNPELYETVDESSNKGQGPAGENL